MTRVMLALIGAAALVFACDGKFEFDDRELGVGGDAQDPPRHGECPECEALGLTCDRDGYPCVECLSDNQCRDNKRPRCHPELRRCVACSERDNCQTAGLTCDLVTHTCVIGCGTVEAPTCDRDFSYCDEQRGVCAICSENRHCDLSPSGPYCVESGTRCVECRKDPDCFEGKVCDPVLFRCVECNTSFDCPRGKQCDIRAHSCVEPLEPAGQVR